MSWWTGINKLGMQLSPFIWTQQHSCELMECLESRAHGDVPIQIPNAFINSAHKWSSPPRGISQMRSLSIICLCWVSQFCIDLKDPATNDTDRGRKMRDLIYLMRKSSLEMLLFDTLDVFKCLNTSCIYHRLQQMALFFLHMYFYSYNGLESIYKPLQITDLDISL